MKSFLTTVVLCWLSTAAFALNFAIIESTSSNALHFMDTQWNTVLTGLGHTATIYPQSTLDDIANLAGHDGLFVASGILALPANRQATILAYLQQGNPVYLQSEYLPTYDNNMAFASIVDSLGGSFSWIATVSGDLIPNTVHGTFATTPNPVTSISYFWYGVHGDYDCRTLPIISYNAGGEELGWQYVPANPALGTILTTTDQDWVRQGTNYSLMENIVHHMLNPPTISTATISLDLGNDTAFCGAGSLVLDATNTGVAYLWQDGSTNPTFTATTAGTYHVTVSDSCSTERDTLVIVANQSTSSIMAAACASYTVPSGDETYTMSGTYTDTIPSALGCDSVITITLTIGSTSSTISPTACTSYTVPSGNATYTATGTYMDTIPNGGGCDSVITINLTVGGTAATISPVVCSTYTVPSGDETYTASGTYMDTIPNAAGCDSVLTVQLTVNSSAATISPTTCTSYTVPSGDETYTVSGVYADTIPNAAGCDSLLTINLTVTASTASTLNPSMCGGTYTVPSGTATYGASGTYMDTIPNAAGCDSVITINLTISGPTSATINPTVCASYTVPSGNATYVVAGTYMDTIPNAAGCDSVLTINLSIGNAAATISESTCTGSYTVPSGNATYTVSGTYMDTIPSAQGCDSVMTINLTVASQGTATIAPAVCGSYTVPSGNATHAASGTYMDTIATVAGCDSIITINLTILGSTAATINPFMCGGTYTVPSGSATHGVSGTYMDTIPNAAGCDSVLTINLTIATASAATISPSACSSYTVPSGDETYTVAGTYLDTIPNAAGCDSILTINLSIGSATATITEATCSGSYTVPSGNATYAVSGTYLDTIPSAQGCDSIITINLTVGNNGAATIAPVTCGSYTVPSGNASYSVSGTYMDTIATISGCDSVITINLTVGASTAATISPATCTGSYTVPSGNATYVVSGTYMDTIPNAAGCDSIITIQLTIGSPTFAVLNVGACTSYTVPSGDETYTVAGTYADTIPNAAGCDSILTINLSIGSATATITESTCSGSYTVPSGNATYTVSGTYLDTIPSAQGCDSIITINLNVGSNGTATIAPVTCGSYTVPSGNANYSVSGTYMDTIATSSGCDSVITINLTVGGTTSAIISPAMCSGSYTVPSGNATYTISGTYMDTIPNAAGCDSIITIQLTIGSPTSAILNVGACANYTVPSGDETYSIAGTYLDTIPNAAGCDSLLTINLSIGVATSTIAPFICGGSYTVPSGNATHSVSGSYTDTIPSVQGCDSIITINLTVGTPGAATIAPVVCGSYTVPSGNATHTTSGIYMDTLTTTSGCDSVLTINLTVGNASTATISPSVCTGSYTVPSGTATYTLSGTYADTLVNASGCDSIITIVLTVGTPTTAIINVGVCTSYTVPSGDETYSVQGTYLDTIPNASGCDSLLTINVTFGVATATISPVVCGASYTVPSGNATYTSSGTYLDTLTAVQGCDSIILINLTLGSPGAATLAPVVCGSYTVPSGNATYTQSGTYTDIITTTTGCDSVLTINLTVSAISTATISPAVCAPYTVPSGTATHAVSGTYNDTLVNADGCDSILTIQLTVGAPSSATLTVGACTSYTVPSGDETHTVAGTYLDTIPNASGCDSLLTINLTFGEATATIDPVLCGGVYTTPSGNATYSNSGTYMDTLVAVQGCDSIITINLTVGTPGAATISPNVCGSYTVPSGTATYTQSGTYMDTLVTTTGCDSVLTIVLTVTASPTSTLSPTVCESYTVPSGSATYTTSGTYVDTIPTGAACDSIITILLTVNNATSATINPGACVSYTVPSGDETYTVAGTYFDTIPNAGGCDSILTINLTIGTATAIINPMVCGSYVVPSGTATLTATGVYTDTLTSTQGCDSVITINLTILPGVSSTDSVVICLGDTALIHGSQQSTAGVYTENYVTVAGCDSAANIVLVVDSFPIFSLGADTSTCDPPFLISAPLTGANYAWSDGSTAASYSVTATEVVGITIEDDSIAACPLTDSVLVTIVDCDTLYFFVPNIFSPNGDGMNDEFRVESNHLATLHGEIYTRWGSFIAEFNGVNASWTGRSFAGDWVPDGTYFYTISAETLSGTTIAREGFVTLVRQP